MYSKVYQCQNQDFFLKCQLDKYIFISIYCQNLLLIRRLTRTPANIYYGGPCCKALHIRCLRVSWLRLCLSSSNMKVFCKVPSHLLVHLPGWYLLYFLTSILRCKSTCNLIPDSNMCFCIFVSGLVWSIFLS